MKVTILQRDIVWADPAENVRRADEAIDCNPGSDLYVLPEMFSTGFCTQPEGIAEPVENETVRWMKAKASLTGAAIAGSIAVHEDGKYYNRFHFVTPDGNITTYDKKHLFTFGGEHKRFTAGSERVIVTYKGFRILLEICYDLRFPVWSRNKGDYDMIIYVASWPTPRVEAWKALLTARAIENQCYVVGVNRVGEDPGNNYCGGSRVIDPYGQIMAECEDGKEMEATAKVDMEVLEAFRAKFPVLDDAD
jgi:predicted amidohydrolase